MEKKFVRSCNFTTKEDCILIFLVKKYKTEVECKRSDTNTNRIKKLAWEKIEKEFNTMSGNSYRNAQVLRNRYDNIKKRTKQKVADVRKNIQSTGGGPPVDIKMSSIEKEMEEIIGPQLIGFPSQFDSDHNLENEKTTDPSCSKDQAILSDFIVEQSSPLLYISDEDNQPSTSSVIKDHTNISESNWGKYNPEMLRTPVSQPLQPVHKEHTDTDTTPNKGSLTSRRHKKITGITGKVEQWAAGKADLVDMQKKCLLEEHKLKLKHMQERHNLMLQLQREEFDLRRKLMQEEHNKKLELLETEILNKKK